MFVQADAPGAYLTWPNPFDALAVMNPLRPEVLSCSRTRSPWAVSCIVTWTSSPDAMNRSRCGSGVYVAAVAWTGAGGACGRPLLVMKAKLTGSTPTALRQAALLARPV